MQNFNSTSHFSVVFKNQKNIERGTSLLDAVNRFAEADAIWMCVLELAASLLSEKGRYAFGLALGTLDAGPATFESPFDLVPDDQHAIRDEAQYMSLPQLTCIGLQLPAILGKGHPEIVKIEGLITALHRLLRNAKAHS